MLNVLKAARPNERPPLYCLNQVRMPKRPEIEPRGFTKAIESLHLLRQFLSTCGCSAPPPITAR